MNITSENRKNYLEAFAFDEFYEEKQINKIITEGLLLFKEIFGFPSKSFTAPNYIWSSTIERELANQNVKYIQGQRKQRIPTQNPPKEKKIAHFTGQLNKYGQIYLIRNCQFEPSLDTVKDTVNECLAQIDNAFKWGTPAIISSHRVNFIGSIESSNRDRNLPLLNDLLSRIQKRWPDTEFMSVDKLGDLILEELQ
jgi:hypothetical protein